MSSLGAFGAAVRELDPGGERDEFTFFGDTFVVEGIIPPILTLQLGAALTGKIGEMEGNAGMWEALRCALTKPEHSDGDTMVPADAAAFERFYRLAVDLNCELDELIKLVFVLFAAQAGRPTEQRPTSQPGPLLTSTSSSTSASDNPASPHLRPVDEVLGG